MKTLYIIPARGGSKGIPGKNIKLLAEKPLIRYAIDTARQLTTDEHICVSTEDEKIVESVEAYGLAVPFRRPASLATDTAGTYEVLLHALAFYAAKDIYYDTLVLLQPTSPFRRAEHVKAALALYTPALDMVVSVRESKANPYYSLFEENEKGYLEKSKKANFVRRQDCPKVYEYNGAVYVINVSSLREKTIGEFDKVTKSEMDELSSLDLDTPLDWELAEIIAKKMAMK